MQTTELSRDIKQMEPKNKNYLEKQSTRSYKHQATYITSGFPSSDVYRASGSTATLKYILTGCEYALRSYPWNHNEVLGIIADATKML